MGRAYWVVLILSSVVAAGTASTQNFATELVVAGLSRPVFLIAPPGDQDRVFVAEQHTGHIRILRLADGTLEATPFVTVAGLSTGNEQGLLGLAFHPAYDVNGYFYVYITDPDSRVLRYQVSADSNVANAASRTEILNFQQPQSNHNGGWIAFGPDGYLYVATGDGGGSDDNDADHTPDIGNAQDITDNFLGKILRIDVDGDDFPLDALRNYAIPGDNPFVGEVGDDEIWAYGLRNPFRSSFDRLTGDLYIADVGQGRCEEVNVQTSASSGGENYGWRLREGTIPTPTGGVGGPAPVGAIDPFFDYSHPGGTERCSNPGAGFEGRSVTGGYVYRGPIAELQGRYFFADFVTAEPWSLLWDGSDPSSFDGTNYTDLTDHSADPRFIPDTGTIRSVSSFGEDDVGNLYVIDLNDGEVFRIPEASLLVSRMIALGTLGIVLRRKRNVDQPRLH